MKIINNLLPINRQNFGNFKWHVNFLPPQKNTVDTTPEADCFVKEYRPARSGDLYDFLKKENKLQISDYYSMSENQKEAVRSIATPEHLSAAQTNIEAALGLKEMLDSKYGNDEYMFVSIGSSPSLIGKVLECCGVETRYLPISGVMGAEDKYLGIILNNCDFTEYRKFLDKQEINDNKEKKILFYDFTITGATLKFIKKLITENFQMSDKNMEFRSLNKDLYSIDFPDGFVDSYKEDWLLGRLVSDYKSIDRYMFNLADDYPPENFTLHDNHNAKLFNFLVMDKLNSLELLKENPKNKCAL